MLTLVLKFGIFLSKAGIPRSSHNSRGRGAESPAAAQWEGVAVTNQDPWSCTKRICFPPKSTDKCSDQGTPKAVSDPCPQQNLMREHHSHKVTLQE